jgi:hypothetical protein
MTRLKIICTHYDEDGSSLVTRAEVRAHEDPDRHNTEPALFAATCFLPVQECKRYIRSQPDADLSHIVYL